MSDVQPDSNDPFFCWIDQLRELVPPEQIQQVLADHGVRILNGRKIPADGFVWMLVAFCLFRKESIRNVLTRFELPDLPSVANISQRRDRLGSEPIADLFYRTAAAWCEEQGETFAGLPVLAADGTTFTVADTPELEERYGRPQGRSNASPSAYPKARAVGLLDIRSRLLCDMEVDHYNTSEVELFQRLLQRRAKPSLFVLDRGYGTYVNVWRIRKHGHHAVMRLRTDFAKNAPVLEENEPGDEWIEVTTSHSGRAANPDVPEKVRVRRIWWHEQGHREKALITTLSPEVASAKELIEMYRTRWEIETAFDELKTHLIDNDDPVHFRSRTPKRVEQEIWGTMLAYNLVRIVMARAAQTADLPPNRMSFTNSLLRMQVFLQGAYVARPGTIPKMYANLLANIADDPLPPRRNRSNPRQVKKRPTRYRKKRVVSRKSTSTS